MRGTDLPPHTHTQSPDPTLWAPYSQTSSSQNREAIHCLRHQVCILFCSGPSNQTCWKFRKLTDSDSLLSHLQNGDDSTSHSCNNSMQLNHLCSNSRQSMSFSCLWWWLLEFGAAHSKDHVLHLISQPSLTTVPDEESPEQKPVLSTEQVTQLPNRCWPGCREGRPGKPVFRARTTILEPALTLLLIPACGSKSTDGGEGEDGRSALPDIKMTFKNKNKNRIKIKTKRNEIK